ncbi:MAG: hypothetical protein IPM24_19785 [Bryobacterales bacterium]|nr:hypothetical protein [Bryobacterales bacterium]
MAVADMILPEFDHEVQLTRKMLERIPNDKLAWKPHEKSMTLGRLAGHLSELPWWGEVTMKMDVLDLASEEMQQPGAVAASAEEAVAMLDSNAAKARAAFAASDEAYGAIWSMKRGADTIMQMPRGVVIRSFVMNHMIHHRAQLGVYLRLLDVPVPATYGPSADDKAGM